MLPVSHVFGLASVLLGTLYQGGRLDLVARFVPEEAARALAEDGITVFQGVPQMHARLLALAKARGRPVAAPHAALHLGRRRAARSRAQAADRGDVGRCRCTMATA